MPWVKFEGGVAFHHQILRVGNEAAGAWFRMACHCAKHKHPYVDRMAASLISPREEVIIALVEAQLLRQHGDGYFVEGSDRWTTDPLYRQGGDL